MTFIRDSRVATYQNDKKKLDLRKNPAVVKMRRIDVTIPSDIFVFTNPGQLAQTAALMPSFSSFLANFRV